MLRIGLKYAVVCGLFLIGLFFISLRLGSNPLVDLNHLFFDLFLFSVFVFVANNEFKKYHNVGYLHFWQGMTIGFWVYIGASFLFMIALTLAFQFNDQLMEIYQKDALAFLEAQKERYLESFGEEQYESQRKAIQEVSVGYLILTTSIKKLLAGLFITPVVSIVLRKKPK